MKYVEEMQKEWINICRPRFQEYYLVEMMLISKYYWLIKWLVENDKIDYHNKINYDISLAINRVPKKTTREERLLMMLAIQDEPIDFLISILK